MVLADRVGDVPHIIDVESLFSLISLTTMSQDYDIRVAKTNLGELVPQWPELNAALFWYDVEDTRTLRDKEKGERLIDWWQARIVRDLWRFESKDIDQVVEWMAQKEFTDDQASGTDTGFLALSRRWPHAITAQAPLEHSGRARGTECYAKTEFEQLYYQCQEGPVMEAGLN